MARKKQPPKPKPSERKSTSMSSTSWFVICRMLNEEIEKLTDVVSAIEGAILTRGRLIDGDRRVELTPTIETCSLICSTSLRTGKAMGEAGIISRSPVVADDKPKPVPDSVMKEALANAAEELEIIKKGEFQND